jgi:hypothetical protein
MVTNVTTIQISKITRDRLRKLGRKGETYDQVLNRLIEMARKAAFFKDIDRILDTEEFVPIEEL